MSFHNSKITRPVALVILDGWGYAPRTEGNAIAIAHTPYYDEICRKYPMTTLAAAGSEVGQSYDQPGNAALGHLNIGTGRIAKTEAARIAAARDSGEFMENRLLKKAFAKAKKTKSALHLIGLLSDGGVHSLPENLFALIRLAKQSGLKEVYIHGILDGVDVPPRTADIYVEAMEIKLADIGLGRIATLCGRFFAMDSSERWERTARAFTMLVHAEGERAHDPITAIRNSFLRGISDEFIAPIVIERSRDVPVAKVRTGDLVVFFNHGRDSMRQLVRSLCVPEGVSASKPLVETVCLVEYDAAFALPVAFQPEPEVNTLSAVLQENEIPTVKITENARVNHLTSLFDGGAPENPHEEHLFLNGPVRDVHPESCSFKIADKFRRRIETSPNNFFVVNLPAADLMAETGDLRKTVAAIQYIDTCIGGICEKVRDHGGVVMLTSTHGNCEQMVHGDTGDADPFPTANPVPFHYVDAASSDVRLADGRSLADVAPTVLGVLNLGKPAEMTGRDLRIR